MHPVYIQYTVYKYILCAKLVNYLRNNMDQHLRILTHISNIKINCKAIIDREIATIVMGV